MSINDRRTALNSTPNVVETLEGNGAPVAVGGDPSAFQLEVDLDACTFNFHVGTWIHATLTTVSDITVVEEGDIALDVIHAQDVLGAWRQLGMAEFDGSYDAHFAISSAAGTKDKAYFPYGFGLELWFGRDQELAEGAATVDCVITPNF